MGLCKCPKKKVTNLFCFEHRVNVCEYCLVESHSKCVVQSYLSWLADSDYDPNCSFCSGPLIDKETVRLQCLHLFHWQCLDAWARSLPANTAPAGYRCPLCNEAVFPAPNQASPTVDRLRNVLQNAGWARAGLGLPLLPELENGPVPRPPLNTNVPQPVIHTSESLASSLRDGTPPTVLEVEDAYTQRARKPFEAGDPSFVGRDDRAPLIPPSRVRDEDLPENKYKRRSAAEWLGRWIRSRYGGSGRSTFDPRSRCKRIFFMVFLALVVLITIFTVLSRMLGGPDENDPAFDPLANPNIRVAAVHEQANQ